MREFRGKIPSTFGYEKYLYYFSRLKVLFNLFHVHPEEGDETLLRTAINITRAYGKKSKISFDEENSALIFFVTTFLEPGGRFFYEEELEKGFAGLIKELEDILEYIHTYVPEPELTP